MKFRIRHILAATLLTVLLAVVAALGWLFGTNEGARWLLHALSRTTSVNLSAKSVDGTLLAGLRIEELHASWPDGRSDIRLIVLRWRPAGILAGRLVVNELSASHIALVDTRPETKKPGPPELSWPKLTGFLSRVSIGIRNLSVDDFVYRVRDNAPVVINRLHADLLLSHGTFIARKIMLATPQIRAEGQLSAGFVRPSFRTDMSLIPASSLSGLDTFRIKAQVLPAGHSRAEGSLTIIATAQSALQAEFESRITVTRQSLGLDSIRLFRPGQNGEVRGNAQVDFTAEKPSVIANFRFNNVDLSKKVPYLNNVNGTMKIEGTMLKYHGSVSVLNKGEGWRNAGLESVFNGTANDIILTSIKGRWVEGVISGSARGTWKGPLAAEASLTVRGLNPGLISPDWAGKINADVSGIVSVRGKQPDAKISLQVLESRIRGQAVTGQLRARVKQQNVIVDRLVFRGKGFSLSADGDLAKRMNIGIRISDLSFFSPEAKGRLGISGWVRQKKDILSGFINANARDLVFQGATVSSVKISGAFENREGRPFSLSITARDAVYKVVRADSIRLETAGTTNQHTVKASLQSSGYTIRMRVAGGYADEIWQGKVSELSGSDPMGRWSLQSPASVKLSRTVFSLSPLVIVSKGEERIELQGAVEKNPLSGSFSLQWQQIDIARANAWLIGVAVSGLTAGRITAAIVPDDRLDMTGNIALSRGAIRRRVQYGELKADINKADVSLTWRGETLAGNLSLVLAEYGRIDARFRAPVPARFPVSLNRTGALEASIKGSIRESGTLSFLFPGMIQESRGQMEINMAARGTWNEPVIEGSLLLDKAGGYFPAAGIHITDIHADVRLEQNGLRIDSFKAHSGRGTLEGKAAVALQGLSVVRYEGNLNGDRFQALFLPQMRMQLSPKIEFHGDMRKLTARGEVRVPELLIYGPPKEAPIKPSDDVVIVGRRQAAEESGEFSMDIEIKVILGDRVIVKAEGADAQLGGELLLSVTSIKHVTARGEITVKKGKYSAYGLSLEISRGRIFFAGGPVENPTLDILALKTIDTVKAGVTVTGTLRKPAVKLYSEPAMPDADILAYIVLGHPLGQDKEQSTYLMQAAGALLSTGQSVALQDQVKQRLGLDTIDIQTGGGNVSRSLVTIGKYLSSKLYVSYGRALFTGENLFRLRYKLGKRWELESHSGQTSGVDLYYMIQFD